MIQNLLRILPLEDGVFRIVTNEAPTTGLPVIEIDENTEIPQNPANGYVLVYKFKTTNPWRSKGFINLHRLVTGFHGDILLLVEVVEENQQQFIPYPNKVSMYIPKK